MRHSSFACLCHLLRSFSFVIHTDSSANWSIFRNWLDLGSRLIFSRGLACIQFVTINVTFLMSSRTRALDYLYYLIGILGNSLLHIVVMNPVSLSMTQIVVVRTYAFLQPSKDFVKWNYHGNLESSRWTNFEFLSGWNKPIGALFCSYDFLRTSDLGIEISARAITCNQMSMCAILVGQHETNSS